MIYEYVHAHCFVSLALTRRNLGVGVFPLFWLLLLCPATFLFACTILRLMWQICGPMCRPNFDASRNMCWHLIFECWQSNGVRKPCKWNERNKEWLEREKHKQKTSCKNNDTNGCMWRQLRRLIHIRHIDHVQCARCAPSLSMTFSPLLPSTLCHSYLSVALSSSAFLYYSHINEFECIIKWNVDIFAPSSFSSRFLLFRASIHMTASQQTETKTIEMAK